MSTIPGGCFVAPDSLRRLNQKQHARQAKLQQASSESQLPNLSIPLSPPAEAPPSPSLARFITNAPQRLTEMFSRTRSNSTPPGTPPLSPCVSPRNLLPGYPLDSETPPPSPFLSPRKNPDQLGKGKDAELTTETTEAKMNYAPMRFSEMFTRTRGTNTPPGTPPMSPSLSPRKLLPGFPLENENAPPSPYLSPRKPSPLSRDANPAVETAETKPKMNSLSQSV